MMAVQSLIMLTCPDAAAPSWPSSHSPHHFHLLSDISNAFHDLSAHMRLKCPAARSVPDKCAPDDPNDEVTLEDDLSDSFQKSATISSTSSGGSDTSSSTGGKSSLSSFSILHPHKSHHSSPTSSKHSKSRSISSSSIPFELPVPTTPIQLVELAISTALSCPGPPIEELRNTILPQLYHKAYSHRVNCREMPLEGLIKVAILFRSKFRSLRVKFKTNLVDLDPNTPATLELAAVALTYDIIATPLHGKKHEIEDKRTSAIGVYKIMEGKLAQSDIVIDTKPFQEDSTKEIACIVM